MAQPYPELDIGTGLKTGRPRDRTLGANGQFKVRKKNIPFDFRDSYSVLVRMPTWKFVLVVLGFYLCVNLFFASVYMLVGPEHLTAYAPGMRSVDAFMMCFFMSAQTLTTVGYGHIAPLPGPASLVSSFEALCGLMFFAIMSGLLYGRFSQPSARIGHSKYAVVGRHNDQPALMFRLANERSNVLVDIHASVLLLTWQPSEAGYRRRYQSLSLQFPHIHFFPLSWTLVHEIGPDSPLAGHTAETLREANAELLILIKGFDDTFSQWVHHSFSYMHHEVLWDHHYVPMFHDAEEGTVLDFAKLHDVRPLD